MPIFRLSNDIEFPPPELAEENGLLAIGGDLSIQRLLKAYQMGIFPWYSEGDPLLWWTPAPRLVLFPEEFHTPRRLARTIRKQVFSVTTDTAFTEVIKKCAGFTGKNREETWITPEMQAAYCNLHEHGYAHSIECWQQESLAGGLYGIVLDRVFFGESMFSLEKDASKVALHALVQHTKMSGIRVIDCQVKTAHLTTLGAREISRESFQDLLLRYVGNIQPQKNW
jgi:leucyl/phenylalanyl-tRNA--protein transferase